MKKNAAFTYAPISSKNLGRWKDVIIPGVFSELDMARKELEDNYLCLGLKADKEYAGALIAHLEQESGDIQILSLYIMPEYRRLNGASGLIEKVCRIASSSYQWDKSEYSTDIFIKIMYALPERLKNDLEAFLKAVGFTQFYIFGEKGSDPLLCGADMPVHIYNME